MTEDNSRIGYSKLMTNSKGAPLEKSALTHYWGFSVRSSLLARNSSDGLHHIK